ncbi:MAG: peptide methionine sulfoxide reductase [Bacteroidota bacterium]
MKEKGIDWIIGNIPIGYSEVVYNGRKYGLSRSDFNQGKSLKVYGEELGGNDFISFNYYLTEKGSLLKPCEMPQEKVEKFILEMERTTS